MAKIRKSEISARLLSLKKVSDEESYNAFSTLVFHEGYYWLAYRTGENHVSPHGKIIIRKSKDLSKWQKVQVLEKEKLDLRDPRMRVLNGELILLAFTLDYYNNPINRFTMDNSFFYRLETNGQFKQVGDFPYSTYKNILWDMFYTHDAYYVSGYDNYLGHEFMTLWRSKSLAGDWEKVYIFKDDMIPPNLGFNETDFVLDDPDHLTCFLRIDRDSYGRLSKEGELIEAKEFTKERFDKSPIKPNKGFNNWFAVGKSEFPFDKWEISPIRMYIKGPRAIKYKDSYLVVGRYTNRWLKKRIIRLFEYNDKMKEFIPLLDLAKGNDGSYAGLAWNKDNPSELLISFYSDHARLKTIHRGKRNDVWIARVNIE